MIVACVALGLAVTGVAQGRSGSAATVSTSRTVYGPSVKMCATGNGCATKLSRAVCPTGMRLSGGGWVFGAHEFAAAKATVPYNGPSSLGGEAWEVEMNNWALIPGGFRAVAICSP